jgi:PAT family beta-lactamase induction signal transducer AmpG
MADALDTVADGFVPRGLQPPLYALVYLPGGLALGFATVTLGYLLSHNGVGVAAIAAFVAIHSLPQTWKFFAGPVIDTSLSPQLWYVIALAAAVLALAGFAVIPLTPAGMPVAMLLGLVLGIGTMAAGTAATAAMALTTSNDVRGAVAGWQQCGNLGGAGLGGGLGLWLAEHAGGQRTAALGLAALCVFCVWPILLIRAPPRLAGAPVKLRLTEVGRGLWAMAKTRSGVLAMIAVTIPAGLGSASQLLSSVAGDWHASADMVALVLGAVTGVANLPGCVLGGYLSDIFPRRIAFIWSALACAAAEAAMAWGPHSPTAFAVFVVLNSVLLGVAWSTVAAVIFDQLSARAAATVASVLSSLCNVPVVGMTALIGSVQARHGSSGMLLTEAAVGVVSVTAYALFAWLWKPIRTPRLNLASSAA